MKKTARIVSAALLCLLFVVLFVTACDGEDVVGGEQ